MPRTFRFNGTLGVDLLRLSLRIAPKSFSTTRASTPVLSMIHAFSLWRCFGFCDYTNPIRSRVHTPSVPSGTAVLGKYLPRIRRRSRHELFWYLCWNCWWRSCHWADCSCAKAGFAARACTWAVQSFYRMWILCAIVSSWECSKATQNQSLNSHLLYGVLLNPPETTAPSWHALINVHGVPASFHPRQRRIGADAVLKTCSSWSHLGQATSSLLFV